MTARMSLRSVAEAQGFDVGAAVDADLLRNDAGYWNLLRREFTAVTPENALKMGPLRPSPDTYDFGDADAVVNFGLEYDMTVRGHTLVWHNQTPAWFEEWEYTDEGIEGFLRDHIHTVAGRYRDKIDAWDVVNEAVADDGSMRETVWYDAMGEAYLDRAFEWADGVTDADLYYNDYGADGVNEKSDAVYDLITRMLDRDVPIDGVGLQLHALHDEPDPESIAANVRRFEDLGLDVQITEMDVAYPEDELPENHRERQAEYYRAIVETCLDTGCKTLVTWGVRDDDSWVPGWFSGLTDDPLLFDGSTPKPAYHAIVDVLAERSN
ncbi:endo-1,4-beta-xylanase [Halococcus sp. IIIV-5B]|uniref:endo-1,4-beta-xylanase n=1 Tax=Halococcus sp. IIIV-5B TaxID=2321230 RepID=UPI000E70732F|nr:endo-1,4-beta-xylanase [Halococcus sp. IIIV-5B]RJT07793.1 endo-1,4-beta-xylanase [Halococcus sp. IIIV-5B]